MATSYSLKFHMKRARAEAKAQGTSFRAPMAESAFAMFWTSETEAKYAAHPELVFKVELPADIQDIAGFSFNRRLNAAIARSCDLLNEAQAQLEGPFAAFLPNELTREKLATEHGEEGWDFLNAKATEFNDVELALNEEHFADVNRLLDELDVGPAVVDVPCKTQRRTIEEMGVPSDIAKWITQSKEAGEKTRSKGQREEIARQS